METKKIKVAYTSRYTKASMNQYGESYTAVPKIQMEGKWLEELGFSIGTRLVIEYAEGSIYIRPMTENELALEEQQKQQKEIRRKKTELRKLERLLADGYEDLSRVAEKNAYAAC